MNIGGLVCLIVVVVAMPITANEREVIEKTSSTNATQYEEHDGNRTNITNSNINETMQAADHHDAPRIKAVMREEQEEEGLRKKTLQEEATSEVEFSNVESNDQPQSTTAADDASQSTQSIDSGEHVITTDSSSPIDKGEEYEEDSESSDATDRSTHESEYTLLQGEDHTIQATLGPVAFWLRYEATRQDIALLNEAVHVQHNLDSISLEEHDQKVLLHDATRSAIDDLRESRDKACDSIPGCWARALTTRSVYFWQEQYWASLEKQKSFVPLEMDRLEESFQFVAVNDYAFLAHGLSQMRCLKHRSTLHGDYEEESITISFVFQDAPGEAYPFQTRVLERTIPLSVAYRFSSPHYDSELVHPQEDNDPDDEMFSDMSDRATKDSKENENRLQHDVNNLETTNRRWLGKGTELHFRIDHAAVTSDMRLMVPSLNSFFALFAPAVLYDALEYGDWITLQARLGILVHDVCAVSARWQEYAEDQDGPEQAARGHDSAYAQWLAEVEADAAAYGAVEGVPPAPTADDLRNVEL